MKRLLAIVGTVLAAEGVPESDAYPMIEYWMANDFRSNPMCTDKGVLKAETYPYRRSLGLQESAKSYMEAYASSLKKQSTSDMVYQSSQRRTTSSYEDMMAGALKAALAKKRLAAEPSAKSSSVSDDLGGVSGAVCNMIVSQQVETESFCNLMAGVTVDHYCQDNYQYNDPNAVYEKVLNPSEDFGVVIPDQCLAPATAAQQPLDLFIQQYRSTPDNLDLSVVGGERKVYYLLWKAIEKLERYAERKLLQAELGKTVKKNKVSSIHQLYRDTEVFETILPEWVVSRVIYTNEPMYKGSDLTLRTPLAVIARRGNNLLMTIRRSLTSYDSRFALYNQQAFKYLYNFTGQLHDGSSSYMQAMLAPLTMEVESLVTSLADSGIVSKLTITAADAPAVGAAAGLGDHLSRQFADQLQVDVVGFGNPYFGDKDFLESVRNNVELRVIHLEGDSTDLLPCAGVLTCDDTLLYIRTGIESGKQFWYERSHGYVSIPLSDLGAVNKAWNDESAVFQVAAIRDCGYACTLAYGACRVNPDVDLCDPDVCESFIRT
ncbi:hypothetical protein GNI_148550 [Gregarina niphandrodes]|uniref:Transmembrane protein n=1 Tax=Gregarina niphandrodes TaxID=110365 RepID=A0A023AZN3_GRENI|nr:hypothetical protein GNI_148550 [Gregarina niphandrodes]EZG44344.1 hypothetical protein GNI_148550 [Gregarina niphandrodes]|eukprot:XP_011132708.1 hypothetical protein GNI_148550 [Gregarina niphandrodes]